MVRRAVSSFAAVVVLTLAGLVVTSPPAGAQDEGPVRGEAQAGPAPGAAATCPQGHACILDHAGQVIYSSAGNVSGLSIAGASVWNNGYRYPGADHIQLFTRRIGRTFTICLHYGPATYLQPDPTVGNLFSDEVATSWYWRGECVGNEDNWHMV